MDLFSGLPDPEPNRKEVRAGKEARSRRPAETGHDGHVAEEAREWQEAHEGRERQERRILSVNEVVETSRELLEQAFPRVFVRGEISNFRPHRASGHWYFKLKDEAAVLDVAMFRSDNELVVFDVEEGMEVILGGRLTIYPARGNFQLVAALMEPVGWGALQLAFEQLKGRLEREGLFAAERKRPLPVLPSCIGVVTSATGAAWRDMRRVWHRNRVPMRIVLAPARVQGSEAGAEIVAAIERLQRHGAAEVIIVARGGGSREDLWAFNEERVARAIAAATVPIVSGVGHEIDTTISDLVADYRAATPTAAAEAVATSRDRLLQRLRAARRSAQSTLSGRLAAARARLNDPRLQHRLRRPAGSLSVYRQRLDETYGRVTTALSRAARQGRGELDGLGRRLARHSPAASLTRRRLQATTAARGARAAIRSRVQERRARLGAAVARVEALSPLAVLARGYAICQRRDDGLIVRKAAQLKAGDRVDVRLSEGRVDCRVEDTHEDASSTR